MTYDEDNIYIFGSSNNNYYKFPISSPSTMNSLSGKIKVLTNSPKICKSSYWYAVGLINYDSGSISQHIYVLSKKPNFESYEKKISYFSGIPFSYAETIKACGYILLLSITEFGYIRSISIHFADSSNISYELCKFQSNSNVDFNLSDSDVPTSCAVLGNKKEDSYFICTVVKNNYYRSFTITASNKNIIEAKGLKISESNYNSIRLYSADQSKFSVFVVLFKDSGSQTSTATISKYNVAYNSSLGLHELSLDNNFKKVIVSGAGKPNSFDLVVLNTNDFVISYSGSVNNNYDTAYKSMIHNNHISILNGLVIQSFTMKRSCTSFYYLQLVQIKERSIGIGTSCDNSGSEKKEVFIYDFPNCDSLGVRMGSLNKTKIEFGEGEFVIIKNNIIKFTSDFDEGFNLYMISESEEKKVEIGEEYDTTIYEKMRFEVEEEFSTPKIIYYSFKNSESFSIQCQIKVSFSPICNPSCQGCFEDSDNVNDIQNCKECAPDYFPLEDFPSQCYKSDASFPRLSKYFFSSNDNIWMHCTPSCSTCKGKGMCTSCSDGFIESDSSKLISENSTCIPKCDSKIWTQNDVEAKCLNDREECFNSGRKLLRDRNDHLECVEKCKGEKIYIVGGECKKENCESLGMYIENGNTKTEDVKCYNDCMDGGFQFHSEDFKCYSECPSEIQYHNSENTCLVSCPSEEKFRVQGETLCRESCPTSHPFYDDEFICYSLCPTGKYIYNNKKCVDTCPEDNPIPDDNNKCGTECPSSKPFFNNDGCHTSCPSTTPYINENNNSLECLSSCPDEYKYIYGNKCFNQCPSNAQFANENKCLTSCPINNFHYATDEFYTCTTQCPSDRPIPDDSGLCISSCPTSTPYSVPNKGCYTQCPDEYPYTTLSEPYVCISDCPVQFPILDNDICTNECPEGALFTYRNQCFYKCPDGFNLYYNISSDFYQCVNKCPGEYTFISNTDECVQSCEDLNKCKSACSSKTLDSQCIENCPSSKPFSLNNICIEECPTGYYFYNTETSECLIHCNPSSASPKCRSICGYSGKYLKNDTLICDSSCDSSQYKIDNDIYICSISSYSPSALASINDVSEIQDFISQNILEISNGETNFVDTETHIISVSEPTSKGNPDTSTVDIGDCKERIKEKYGTDKVLVGVVETKDKSSRCFDVNYELYLEDGTHIDKSICDGISVSVSSPIRNSEGLDLKSAEDFQKDGIDVFDRESSFFNDICVTYSSNSSTDVTLDDRVGEYYQEADFCADGCVYVEVDYTTNNAKCECNMNTNNGNNNEKTDNEEIKKKGGIKDTFLESLKKSNFKVVVCYKLVFSINFFKSNYGGMILGSFYIMQWVAIILYKCIGMKNIRNIIRNSFEKGKQKNKIMGNISKKNENKGNEIIDNTEIGKTNNVSEITNINYNKNHKNKRNLDNNNQTVGNLNSVSESSHDFLVSGNSNRKLKVKSRNNPPKKIAKCVTKIDFSLNSDNSNITDDKNNFNDDIDNPDFSDINMESIIKNKKKSKKCKVKFHYEDRKYVNSPIKRSSTFYERSNDLINDSNNSNLETEIIPSKHKIISKIISKNVDNNYTEVKQFSPKRKKCIRAKRRNNSNDILNRKKQIHYESTISELDSKKQVDQNKNNINNNNNSPSNEILSNDLIIESSLKGSFIDNKDKESTETKTVDDVSKFNEDFSMKGISIKANDNKRLHNYYETKLKKRNNSNNKSSRLIIINENQDNFEKPKTEKIIVSEKDKKNNIINNINNDELSEDNLEFNRFELNYMEYEESIIFDKRRFWRMFFDIFLVCNNFIYPFCVEDKLALKAISLSFFFFSLTLSMAINSLFYDDSHVSHNFKLEGVYDFTNDWPISLYSWCISIIIGLLLTTLSNMKNRLIYIRVHNVDKNERNEEEIISALKCKLTIYFIIVMLFDIIFWYYVSAFCAVYRNNQKNWFIDCLISFAMDNLASVLIAFAATIFRYIGIKRKSPYVFCIADFLFN